MTTRGDADGPDGPVGPDPLDAIVGLFLGFGVPLWWVVRWSAGGAEPLAAAWAASEQLSRMSVVVAVAGPDTAAFDVAFDEAPPHGAYRVRLEAGGVVEAYGPDGRGLWLGDLPAAPARLARDALRRAWSPPPLADLLVRWGRAAAGGR